MSDRYEAEGAGAHPYDALAGMSFRLGGADYIDGGGGEWSLPMQFLESHALLYTAGGRGWLTVDGKFIELRPGCAYIGVPGQLVEAFVHSLDQRGLYHMRFDVIVPDKADDKSVSLMKRNSRFPARGELTPASPVSIGALCEEVVMYSRSDSGLQQFGGQIRFQELLYALLQDDAQMQERDPDAALEYVKRYIERNYKHRITIDELAQVARMSPRHFMRLFKKRYGCSAIDYLAVHRIKQAQMLMRSGGHHRLKDIARHVGYQDDMYFRRKFKQISGIPPAAFLRNSRQRIAACHAPVIGSLLALGIAPCAAPESHPWTDYYRRKYAADQVLPLSPDFAVRLEQLRRVKPDYMVALDDMMSGTEHELLEGIAPVCVIPWREYDWRTHLRLVAEFLGRSAVAESWLERYERKVELVKSSLAGMVGERGLLIVQVRGQELQVPGPHSVAAVFYDDLRLPLPRGVEVLQREEAVSLEWLLGLDADRMLVMVDEDAASQACWQSLIRSGQWRDSRAVRSGRVDLFPASPLNEYTAFTHELVLDEVLKLWRNRA